MFFDAISKIGSSMINIPITAFQNQTGNIVSTLGVGLPGSTIPYLEKIGFSHNQVEEISKSIFETSGKTLTGHWMDATGPFGNAYPENISVWYHRIANHHFITDSIRALKNPNLSFIDFYKHLATDVVTKNGLPLLPESLVRDLASLLGTTPTKIMPWVSMNILDIGASVLALSHSTSNILEIIYGNADWGFGYAIDTFGIGSVEIASGIASANPILIGAGTIDVACGTITAYDYYTQPFFCGVPVNDIISSSVVGTAFASIIAGTEIFLKRKKTAKKEKILLFSERVSTASLISGLSAIAIPLSVTTSFGITGYKLAKTASQDTNNYIKAIPLTGSFSNEIDEFITKYYLGKNKMQRILKYIE